MNWENVLDEIQSPKFDAALNVVSSTNGFFQAVEKHPTVREAFRQMLGSGEVREDAIGRIFDLASREIDLEFENPHDTALAVLLWLTTFAANNNLQVAAAYVARAPQCWYAKKLAQRILNPPQAHSTPWNFVLSDETQRRPSTEAGSGSTEVHLPPMTELTEPPVKSHRYNPMTSSSVSPTKWTNS